MKTEPYERLVERTQLFNLFYYLHFMVNEVKPSQLESLQYYESLWPEPVWDVETSKQCLECLDDLKDLDDDYCDECWEALNGRR